MPAVSHHAAVLTAVRTCFRHRLDNYISDRLWGLQLRCWSLCLSRSTLGEARAQHAPGETQAPSHRFVTCGAVRWLLRQQPIVEFRLAARLVWRPAAPAVLEVPPRPSAGRPSRQGRVTIRQPPQSPGNLLMLEPAPISLTACQERHLSFRLSGPAFCVPPTLHSAFPQRYGIPLSVGPPVFAVAQLCALGPIREACSNCRAVAGSCAVGSIEPVVPRRELPSPAANRASLGATRRRWAATIRAAGRAAGLVWRQPRTLISPVQVLLAGLVGATLCEGKAAALSVPTSAPQEDQLISVSGTVWLHLVSRLWVGSLAAITDCNSTAAASTPAAVISSRRYDPCR